MRKFFRNLFSGKTVKSSKISRVSGKRPQNLQNRALRMEQLEDILTLAGVPIPVPVQIASPSLKVNTLPTPPAIIVPGQSDVPLARFDISANGHSYGRLDELMLVPAGGSEMLAQNITGLHLWADVNGKKGDGPRNDGYEVNLGYAQASWQTDVVDFTGMYRPEWAGPSSVLHLEVTADFSGYLSGSAIGVDVAWVGLRDLRDQPVPDTNVAYAGASPTLQKMLSATMQASQQQQPQAASVLPGDQINPMQFYLWNNNASPTGVTLVASQGSLLEASGYKMTQDWNYDGVPDVTVQGVVTIKTDGSNGKLYFDFGKTGAMGGTFDVYATAGKVVGKDPFFKLDFPADGSGLTGTDLNTGKPLQGVAVNGSGPGQVRLYANQLWSTVYTIVSPPAEVVVKEIAAPPMIATANPGDTIVLDSFTIHDDNSTAQNPAVVNHVAIVATQGDLRYSVVNYALWADTDNDHVVDTKLAKGSVVTTVGHGVQVWFDDFQQKAAGGTESTLFQVRAEVPDPLIGSYIQTQVCGYNGVGAQRGGTKIATDKIFSEYDSQTLYELQNPSGGMGSIDDLLAQIAQLQAQLNALQGGGMG
jgi:hypothetical protein